MSRTAGTRDYYLGRIHGLFGHRPALDSHGTEFGTPVDGRIVQGSESALDAVLALDAGPLIYAEALSETETVLTFEIEVEPLFVHVGADGKAFVWGDSNEHVPFPPAPRSSDTRGPK